MLLPGKLYRTAANTLIFESKKCDYEKVLLELPANSTVLFLEYSKGTVRKCKVVFGNRIGWILVDRKYKKHHFFFKEHKE